MKTWIFLLLATGFFSFTPSPGLSGSFPYQKFTWKMAQEWFQRGPVPEKEDLLGEWEQVGIVLLNGSSPYNERNELSPEGVLNQDGSPFLLLRFFPEGADFKVEVDHVIRQDNRYPPYPVTWTSEEIQFSRNAYDHYSGRRLSQTWNIECRLHPDRAEFLICFADSAHAPNSRKFYLYRYVCPSDPDFAGWRKRLVTQKPLPDHCSDSPAIKAPWEKFGS